MLEDIKCRHPLMTWKVVGEGWLWGRMNGFFAPIADVPQMESSVQ
jgi:hypothetical protein